MAWYSTGTVSVTNGGTTVNGAGTGWFGALQDGWGFVGPDGRAYEIASVTDATTLVLDTPYQGATASGQSYACFPTMSLAQDLASAFQTIQAAYEGYIDTTLVGKFQSGTEAQPGISFVEDPDTGVRRVASNHVALVAGGVDQLKLIGGAASGAAVQSDTNDATAGKLLKVGAFGLAGGALLPPNNDFDDIVDGGIYYGDIATSNMPPATNVVLWHGRRTSTIHAQIAVSRSNETLGRVYSRAKDGTVWSDWSEIYGQSNLLGTVSQSGGVPTGAVIERGSNANGEYVKVADGTMFCQHFVASALSSNVATGNIFTSADYTWTFPAPFITSTDAYVACTPLTSANVWGKGRTTATTTGVARLYSSASTGAVSISLYASGRWFT